MRLRFLAGNNAILLPFSYLPLKITEILTCVILNYTQQKELASFYNIIERNKSVCD